MEKFSIFICINWDQLDALYLHDIARGSLVWRIFFDNTLPREKVATGHLTIETHITTSTVEVAC